MFRKKAPNANFFYKINAIIAKMINDQAACLDESKNMPRFGICDLSIVSIKGVLQRVTMAERLVYRGKNER